MFNRTNLLIVIVAIVGAALGLFVGRNFNTPADRPVAAGIVVLKPGDTRPDLELLDADGKPHRLSEWNGKLVMLNFWATWCEPCREEMPLLARTRAAKQIEVVGIAIDNPAAVKDFLRENPVAYPILLGSEEPDTSVPLGNSRDVLPFSVLVGGDGKILAQHTGSFTSALLDEWLRPYLPKKG